MQFTIAIDGPAAAGKGTISKAIAAHFGFAHLDTGLLYRAIGKKLLPLTEDKPDHQMAEIAAKELVAEDLEADDLRNAQVAQIASQIATIAPVRKTLVEFQRNFAIRDGGAVLDGRDIGSVICPEADVKLFITANDETRAKRRFEELSAKGADTSYATVLADLKIRDARDAGREAAPMVAPSDAVLIDTTDLSIDHAVAEAVTVIQQKMRQHQG